MNIDILISVLSWEDRFGLALEKNIREYSPARVLLFKYKNPLTAEWKTENLRKAKTLLNDQLIEIEIDGATPDKNWFIFKEIIQRYCHNKQVLVDITTMTRESIWLSLYNCKHNHSSIHFIYYRPEGYTDGWISRDPGKPRLLYKMSGVAKLGAPTLLIVTGGYDIQRLDSLIYNFEPKTTMLFFQQGNDKRNKDVFLNCKELLRTKYNITSAFEYDAFDIESSFELITNKLIECPEGKNESYLDSYNIIFNSLGAKTSAITLFNIWLKYPQTALSYIPSKEYNREYSYGIGESTFAKID